MIGPRIRKLREDRNLSREQMADHLGISLRTYSKIETNCRHPDLQELGRIAALLGMSARELQFSELQLDAAGMIAREDPAALGLVLESYRMLVEQQRVLIAHQQRLLEGRSRE